MSRQMWVEMLAWATANGTAIASSTTETIIFPNVTIPANYMQDGRALRIRMYGVYGTTSTPTLIFSVRWGAGTGASGTVLAKSSTITTTSGTGSGASMTAMWSLEITIQTRANGSSGSLLTNGEGVIYNSASPTSGTVTNYGLPFVLASGSTGGTTPVAVTVDLTADTALGVTALWGTNNSANSLQGQNFELDSKN